MKIQLLYIGLLIMVAWSCAPNSMIKKETKRPMISIIPKPVKIEISSGNFLFTSKTTIEFNDKKIEAEANYLADLLEKRTGVILSVTVNKTADPSLNTILLKLNKPEEANDPEAYRIAITPQSAVISANSAKGIFYGIQTFRQLCEIEFKPATNVADFNFEIPCLVIEDAPRYKWRGMMLDVSRHFFPKEFVKDFIDYLAMYKLNTFHWHLTDDQGWRIEIKKYPKLTEVGAWRVDREDRNWNDRPAQETGEEANYGGFYTQEEIKEVVEYAKSRHITIISEIEMPGHTVAALAAYPQYSCSGGPFTVLPGGYWPVSDIYCAGNDSTFLFIKDILSEVMDLFPGEYIHIGGDEADKANWEKCPKCQKRIADEKLANEHELQSYFIKRVEAFINSKGKKLIGWDEILEGGLAPRATVMSWRGFDGGITAARSGHHVVMTPTSHCYFDYYQGQEDFEPPAIGGNIPLKRVYSFDPTPDSLTAEEAEFILGGQANLWTEYIPTPEHAQYMIFPRIAALSEDVWTPKNLKDWNDFAYRVEREMDRLQSLGINFAKSSLRVGINGTANLEKKQFIVELSCELPQMEIRYTTDGTEPDKFSSRYSDPIVIEKNITVKAAAFRGKDRVSPVFTKSLGLHKATAKKVDLTNPPAERYSGSGPFTLTNSIHGSLNHADGNWLGFEESDVEAVVDLGAMETIRSISSTYLNNINSWIFLPRKVTYEISADGINYEQIGMLDYTNSEDSADKAIKDFSVTFAQRKAKYIRLKAKNIGRCPDGHMGAGEKAWLFIDEIVVN